MFVDEAKNKKNKKMVWVIKKWRQKKNRLLYNLLGNNLTEPNILLWHSREYHNTGSAYICKEPAKLWCELIVT